MRPVVVVEGQTEHALFQRIVEQQRLAVEVRAASGLSAAESLARSLLAIGAERVALVVDADAVEPEPVQDRKRLLDASLSMVAPRARWHLMLFVPSIEEVLLESPATKRELFRGLPGQKTTEDARELLRESRHRRDLLRRVRTLSANALQELLARPDFSSLLSFLESAEQRQSASSVHA